MTTPVLRRPRDVRSTLERVKSRPNFVLYLFGMILIVLAPASLPWRVRVTEELLSASTLGVHGKQPFMTESFEENLKPDQDERDTDEPPHQSSTEAPSKHHSKQTDAPIKKTHDLASRNEKLAIAAKIRSQRFQPLPKYDPNKTIVYTTTDASTGIEYKWGWNVPGVSKYFYTHGLGRSFGPTMKLPTPVLVVGMPKSGTTSLRDFFRCNGHNASHWKCPGSNLKAYCAHTIRHNIREGRLALYDTGRFQVYAQMDVELPRYAPFDKDDICYMPQVHDLEKLHEGYPHATFVLNRRNVTTWIHSLRHFMAFDQKLKDCNLTDFPPGVGETDDELGTFYQNHLNNVREFVKRHPSHALVEVDILSPTAGSVLAEAFGLQEECWVKRNAGIQILDTSKEESIVTSGRSLPLIGDNETWGTNVPGVPRAFYTTGVGDSFGPPMQLPGPALVVGLPRMGTASIFDFFLCNGHNASRYWCGFAQNGTVTLTDPTTGRPKSCGIQIWENIHQHNVSAMHGLVDYAVYTELGAVWPLEKPPNHTSIEGQCYMPQVNNLDELHQASPNATWILNTADPDHWIESLRHYRGWYDKFRNCDLRGFPIDPVTTTDDDFRRFYHRHNEYVREFVRDHPSHALVEINVEDTNNAGKILADAFGLRNECWTKRNEESAKKGVS